MFSTKYDLPHIRATLDNLLRISMAEIIFKIRTGFLKNDCRKVFVDYMFRCAKTAGMLHKKAARLMRNPIACLMHRRFSVQACIASAAQSKYYPNGVASLLFWTSKPEFPPAWQLESSNIKGMMPRCTELP